MYKDMFNLFGYVVPFYLSSLFSTGNVSRME